ncbi:uncharacterized protein UHO2_00981 [Ustilago hordei]|uniref:uncharacterized protein n=1 Tax=Ustilago hordei TaxID=120017 RepID=UPI001A4665F8|nr:uncharacterized protein UHO2_00981 [Ustilago hordei]SYW74116.1 uncharacterized protein UHO2_00981 [Ustilago hordei]
MLKWAYDKGIEWQMTVGYNSKQNRHVERMNRSLGEKMRMLLMQRRLPRNFWLYAIWAAAFKMNLTPNVDGEFPYQVMFGKPPERLIKLLRVFGCLAWVNIPKVKRDNKRTIWTKTIRQRMELGTGFTFAKDGFLLHAECALSVLERDQGQSNYYYNICG